MELKRLITHFTYRIEPKPEGGFIAHAADPTVPPIEAPTREELQQKIRANIAAGLASEFPGLKLPLENQDLKVAFHIERTPGGGFTIHSADANSHPIEAASHEDIESHFAEKLIGFVGKHLAPELSQALAGQGNLGDVKVFVNRKTGLRVNLGSRTLSFNVARDLTPASSAQPGAKIEPASLGNEKAADSNFGGAGDAISNSPITPETSRSWTIFRTLLVLLIIATALYFFLHHR
jgi:hypothetical protein